MSIQQVKDYFAANNLPYEVIEFSTSTATVELAAAALNVEPARIAKTMAFRLKDQDILILATGDVRVDNQKFKMVFGQKARFISAEEVEAAIGHAAGGVCPFGLARPLPVYLDNSLKSFDVVFPAGGGSNTAVRISVDQLADVTRGVWIDVCSSRVTP